VELPDVGAGEYLTVEEMTALPTADQERYCLLLETRLDALAAERRVTMRQTDSLSVIADSLRQAALTQNRTYRNLQTEVRQLKLRKKTATTYVVREGDTLTRISSLLYGTGARWEEIYEANQDILDGPTAALKPGTRLQIPQ
jgi:nucleoid-associated protein YgaU